MNLERIKAVLGSPYVDDWTKGFCESLFSQVEKGESLSPRQLEILLEKERLFNSETDKVESVWLSDWNEEKAEIFSVCIHYYKLTGYFRSLVYKSEIQGFIPSRRQYNKTCNNKYAMKVRKAWFAEPKYPVGSCVALRPSAPSYVSGGILPKHKDGQTIAYFVLEANSSPPVSASAGAKMYLVVSVGSPHPVELEERHIKNLRRKKKK